MITTVKVTLTDLYVYIIRCKCRVYMIHARGKYTKVHMEDVPYVQTDIPSLKD